MWMFVDMRNYAPYQHRKYTLIIIKLHSYKFNRIMEFLQKTSA
jgi:hypothetical protein